MNFLQKYAHVGGRILLSMIFITAGLMKLQDPSAFISVLAPLKVPVSGAYALILAEIIGGAMILIGFQTRNAAIVLSCLYLSGTVLFNLTVGTQAEIMVFFQKLGLAGGFLGLLSHCSGQMSAEHLAPAKPTAAQ